MKTRFSVEFADRLKSAAAARQSRLDKLQPKPAQTDPLHAERAGLRKDALSAVRAERLAARAAKKQAAVEAAAEALSAQAAAEEAELDLKRGARKARKALSTAEAKAKRDAKYAARKARG